MRTTLRLITLFAAITAAYTLNAQNVPLSESSSSDIQARFGASLEIPIGTKFSAAWNEEVRLNGNLGSVDKILSGVSAEYAPLRYLKAGAEYAFVNEHDAGRWRIQHRLNLNVTGICRIGIAELSLRERVRFEFGQDSPSPYEGPDPFITLRTRLKGAFAIPDSRWKPYAYAEVYTTLNAAAAVDNRFTDRLSRDNYINRVRLTVGAEFDIDDDNALDFYYMVHFNREYAARYDAANGDLDKWSLMKECCHVFGIDYKFKL